MKRNCCIILLFLLPSYKEGYVIKKAPVQPQEVKNLFGKGALRSVLYVEIKKIDVVVDGTVKRLKDTLYMRHYKFDRNGNLVYDLEKWHKISGRNDIVAYDAVAAERTRSMEYDGNNYLLKETVNENGETTVTQYKYEHPERY